jgi:hypothetical protein
MYEKTSSQLGNGPRVEESKHRMLAREFMVMIDREGGTDEDYYKTAVELASLVYERLELTKHQVNELMNFNRERTDYIEKYQSVISSMIQKL